MSGKKKSVEDLVLGQEYIIQCLPCYKNSKGYVMVYRRDSEDDVEMIWLPLKEANRIKNVGDGICRNVDQDGKIRLVITHVYEMNEIMSSPRDLGSSDAWLKEVKLDVWA